MIKAPNEYKNFCPGYFISLSIAWLASLATLIPQASAAPMKYTVSEKTLQLPHQIRRFGCTDDCPELAFLVTDPKASDVTVEQFKQNGVIELEFPYVSNENSRSDGKPDRKRTIKTSPNDNIVIEYCDEESKINSCRFRIKSDLTKLGDRYDKNLGTSERILCYYNNKKINCRNYQLN